MLSNTERLRQSLIIFVLQGQTLSDYWPFAQKEEEDRQRRWNSQKWRHCAPSGLHGSEHEGSPEAPAGCSKCQHLKRGKRNAFACTDQAILEVTGEQRRDRRTDRGNSSIRCRQPHQTRSEQQAAPGVGLEWKSQANPHRRLWRRESIQTETNAIQTTQQRRWRSSRQRFRWIRCFWIHHT